MTLSVFDQNPNNKQKTTSGTTTAAYVAAETIYNGLGAVFVIQNNDASNNMNYKVDVYMDESAGAIAYPVKAETSIDGAATPVPVLETSCNVPFYKAVVSVKDGTGGHSAYQIDTHKY